MNYANAPSIKISVVIPAYNRENTIRACIESIVRQTLPPTEIIVVDDNSDDRTADIAASYSQVAVIRLTERKGAQHARNVGIKAATSQWIAFNDSDDIWLTDKLEIQSSHIKAYGSNIYHSYFIVNEDGFYRNWHCDISNVYGEAYKQILQGSSPLFQTIVAEKKTFEHIGFLDEQCPSYQEWETSIRLAKHFNFIYINKPTFIYSFNKKDSISKDKKLSIKGYEYITHKHKRSIVEIFGIEDLKARYRHILQEYVSVNDQENILRYNSLLKHL